MIDDNLWNPQPAYGVCKVPEAFDVADVEDDEEVCLAESRCPFGRCVHDVGLKQEIVRLRPWRGVDDTYCHSLLRENSRKSRFRSAAVSIRVDMGGDCNR